MLSTMRFRLFVPLLLAVVSVMAAVPVSAGATTTTKSGGCGRKAASGTTTRHVTVGDTEREYLLAIPDGYDPSKPAPLLSPPAIASCPDLSGAAYEGDGAEELGSG